MRFLFLFLAFSLSTSLGLLAQRPPCPEEPPLINGTGAGTVTCPCFVQGEQGGAVFLAPADHYPIEILRVGIGWGSQFGGAPQSLEQSIHIYAGGLPNPGVPIASLDGPLLTDGFVNEFDLEPLPGEIVIASGPFTVSLEFFNTNAGDVFAPSLVHDGNGCTPGQNVVFAIPGGWFDACALGVTGDWSFQVVYRPADCTAGSEFFIRGDADGDGLFNGIVDGLFNLNAQFMPGAPLPPCFDAADADNDGTFNGLLDGLRILNFQFIPGSPMPPPPFPDCGPDDDATLGCETPPVICS